MKKVLFFLILFITCDASFSQDLIITAEGDSINCTITSLKGEFIHFKYLDEGEIRRTLISKDDVAKSEKGFLEESEIAKLKAVKDFDRIRFSVGGGYAYRIGKISKSVPDDFRSYVKDLKSGVNLDLDVVYYFSETSGVGLKYNQFTSSNSIDQVSADLDGDGITEFGKMSDDIKVYFIGPVFSTRLLRPNKKNGVYSNLGIGYLGYRNNSEITGFNIDLKGATVGLYGEIGYQLGISKGLSLGTSFSYVLGSLSKIDVNHGDGYRTNDLDDDEVENLSRINLSVGLIFH